MQFVFMGCQLGEKHQQQPHVHNNDEETEAINRVSKKGTSFSNEINVQF